MGSTAQEQRGESKNSISFSTSSYLQLVSENRRHFNSILTCCSSNSGAVYVNVASKGILQRGGQHRLEAQQGDLWTPVVAKSMARSPGRHFATHIGPYTTENRTKCIQNSRSNIFSNSLHTSLRRRPAVSRTTVTVDTLNICYYDQQVTSQWDKQSHFLAETSNTKEHTLRSIYLANDQNDRLQPGSNSRDGIPEGSR